MKKFIITISLIIIIPLIILTGIYSWTDPFRCIHSFDINDVDDTNREYLSTELFLRNNQRYHYNSFIFCSSRGGGLNTYTWNIYLPDGARPFLFQAWAETITGIEGKLDYLQKNNIPMNNAIVLLDIPSSFDEDQLPYEALSMKHFLFTGQSKFSYNAIQYFNYIQKPSLWISSIDKKVHNKREHLASDTITNDYLITNCLHYTELPEQDSLKRCPEKTRQMVLRALEEKRVRISPPLITSQFEEQLRHVYRIFNECHTDFQIVLSPAYCYLYPAVNPEDLMLLEDIFGKERVHNYTGYNEYTKDYNNFYDPNHFGLRIGYLLLQDIYK